MKRLLTFVGTVILACVLLVAASIGLQKKQHINNAKVLNLYNWGDYIDP